MGVKGLNQVGYVNEASEEWGAEVEIEAWQRCHIIYYKAPYDI